jgi:hypothetical protein
MTYVGMGQWRPNKGKSKGFLAVDDAIVYATFEPSDRAELMTVFAAGNRKSLSKQSSNLASDGYAIFDPGCTKAMISEHAKRLLVTKLEAAGVSEPITNKRETHTRFAFADGGGTTTKPGYKADMAVLLGGKKCKSEWEVLAKGTTPPLWSLPQSKNMHFDVKFRPWGCTVSSEKLGWLDKPMVEHQGHLLVNLVETTYKVQAQSTVEPQQVGHGEAAGAVDGQSSPPHKDTEPQVSCPEYLDPYSSRLEGMPDSFDSEESTLTDDVDLELLAGALQASTSNIGG